MYVIRNATIVTPHSLLTDKDLLIKGDRIEAFLDRGTFCPKAEEINANGAFVMPGFIDLHSDYIEFIASPRPSSLMDFRLALRESERELITHGITTMFHSLSLYRHSDFGNRPIREAENVERLIQVILDSYEQVHLVRHRFHARFEIDNIEQLPLLERYIQDRKVHLISFMDHSPGQGQYRDLQKYRNTVKGYRNINDHELDKIIEHHRTKEKLTLERIEAVTMLARNAGIPVASHDDDCVEKILLVKSWGTTISEFPITMEVARAARKEGLYTVAGAPNVLLGGSHAGNLNAAEAILDGSIDILCSDYYPASLLHGLFKMHRTYGLPLQEMVKLVTLYPARAVGLDAELGSIEIGKRADLVVVQCIEENFPVVTTALVDGTLVFQTHYRTPRHTSFIHVQTEVPLGT
ncbi:MAG: phosphonate metabolism protein PhnM [Treponemataceae bacterium]|nr:phosphonate metabolism protein PhnM [Treponemataceae bacterium]